LKMPAGYVDRSYLPFKSARNYQDRKMAKWMGFFISEHTTALTEHYGDTIEFTDDMPLDEKLLYLSQAYIGKHEVTIRINKVFFTGVIDNLTQTIVGMQAKDKHYQLKLLEICSIQLAELEET
ncbi:TPA: hypothetical protein ACGO1T_001966, partial [Streptococcus suis]